MNIGIILVQTIHHKFLLHSDSDQLLHVRYSTNPMQIQYAKHRGGKNAHGYVA